MECLGGNGYVEDGALARLYREAPVNAIWEGSGNVMGLDVLRVFAREPDTARAVLAELAQDAKDLAGVTETSVVIGEAFGNANAEANARAAVERLARLAAAAALKDSAPQSVAEAFARVHLSDRCGATYGTGNLDAGTVAILLDRAMVAN
jgi:putative acyl-CoA dehydrogenase